ncbi:formate dehydrogenase accessory sulfurtransferase FdhD [Marinobacterium rhizophilum]|uniref:Sulfur carrier protein FdhD n=1 Tax=Marinobacterium rhizophilum TaxID=420402 RepID=A0ABY5HL85_9GAMM|nr:formate dehydrogenase accessory sulfurtransferase FdhD [Marinobacterium rhizophilum]UTW13153.1 formate dehydrogenase accessory sulfurtransferase FdhD [Marinobacterium rhizophilum]
MGSKAPGSREARVDIRMNAGATGSQAQQATDCIAEEVPVALVFNGISHAVMMASPSDLDDFALGFSLTEGILQHPDELYDIEVVQEARGISVQMQISAQRLAQLKQARRNLTGRTGCGLCGTESLEQAIRPIARVQAPKLSDQAIQRALADLQQHQPLQGLTGASHGAAWCNADGEILLAREDVGRHNALDKLIGALIKARLPLENGFALVSSRASYEMVQKSCSAGIGALVAVSAPTALAIEQAQQAGLMLVGFARPGRHVIYHPGNQGQPENTPHSLNPARAAS